MSKQNNLTDFLTDVADAIREKKGTTDKINPQDFSDEIKGIKTFIWTGHVDVEGLKAIGWDDEDIAYYQEHGVDWMEEDDEYHKVSDDNKALYGVLTADNIQEYKDRIVWLPKIDLSNKDGTMLFYSCIYMVGIPKIDTSHMTSMASMFTGCRSLVVVPKLDVENVRNIVSCFTSCYSLLFVDLEFNKITYPLTEAFQSCYSLKRGISIKEMSVHQFNTMYANCYNINVIPCIDMQSDSVANNTFYLCHKLGKASIKNLCVNISFAQSPVISSDSVLYIINNEATKVPITITLHKVAYARLATDADIVEALNNHPLVSLASA